MVVRSGRRVLVGAVIGALLATWVVSAYSGASAIGNDGTSGGRGVDRFLQRLTAAFAPDIEDCEAVRSWMADHPEAFMANDSVAGLQLRMRSLNALVAVCDEAEWEADLTSGIVADRTKNRGSSMLFVLEARHQVAQPASMDSTLNSWCAPDALGAWKLVQGADTFPCVFSQEEATGGIVPGVNLLLGFDRAENVADLDVLYRTGAERWLRFSFDRAALREMNDRLPVPVKNVPNTRKA